MKIMFSFLIAFLLSASILPASAASDKDNNKKQNSTKNEIKDLFNKNVLKPLQRGSVVALVKIDAEGYGRVLESNASTAELEEYVKNKLEGKKFKNLKSDTIKVKVEFKK
jgi:biopolymer transport protein ExbD